MKKILISIGLLASISMLAACDPGDKYVHFAKCLTETGAKMYGTFWCPHCLDQKRMFGEKGFKEINYTECDYRGKNANPVLCAEKKITGFPTWEFKDSFFVKKLMTLEELSLKTGCSLPKEEK